MRRKIFKHDFPLELGTDVIFCKVISDAWKQDYKVEELNATFIGDNMYRITCVPLLVYGLNRHDVVEVSDNGFVIEKIKTGKHRSIRILLYNHDYYDSLIESLNFVGIGVEYNSHTFFGLDIISKKQEKITLEILDALVAKAALAYEFS